MTAGGAVLVIAGSDSSGGAGIVRDLTVLRDFGVAARCAITAVTVQTHDSMRATHVVPADMVRAQIRAARESGPLGAVKIGMLADHATVRAVIDTLPSREALPIVLDPVLVSSSGGRLLDFEGQQLMIEQLLPQVTLLTPNIPEAAQLLGVQPATAQTEGIAQARELQRRGPAAVLLKGGHATGKVVTDLLVTDDAVVRLRASRVEMTGSETAARGTGCALASAIAAGLASGRPLSESCRAAQRYVRRQLLARRANADT